MPSIDRATWKRLESDLLAAEDGLPILVREIMRSMILRRELLRECSPEEGMLGQWNQTDQVLTFNGPLIARLSPEALAALVAHEAGHIWCHFTNDPRGNDEAYISDLAAQWGADTAALYQETRGV